MPQIAPPPARYDAETQIVIIGGGACGLTAGLAALDAGGEAIVVERDPTPSGSTAMSSGFIPAPTTRFQRALGVTETPEDFARDIQKKAGGGADPSVLEAVAAAIGPTLEWLADGHGLEWQVLGDFLYPGHSRHRMHAVPEKTGTGLMTRLGAAAEATGLTIVTDARAAILYTGKDRRITGVALARPDGRTETIGCRTVILACNGYGGNPDMVARHIPEIAPAPYFGHPGNTGDALTWGQALGAAAADLTAYQGHGSLAHPHGILITWALMMEGAIQVNSLGQRFANEHKGYSEQAVKVLAQPGGVAWNIYDARLHRMGLEFPDYRQAVEVGAIRTGADTGALATEIGVPAAALEQTIAEIEMYRQGTTDDPFGRAFSGGTEFAPPLHAVRVTGALFHTQGGLCVDRDARVVTPAGAPLPNLFAGGGAARGVSGARVEGYLSGNGLLTAVGLGAIAGRRAAGGV